MNKKGSVGNFILILFFLILSGVFFYSWAVSKEPAICSTSSSIKMFYNSSLFAIGVICLILAVAIIYSTFRPVTGCWGEIKDPVAFAKAMDEMNRKEKKSKKFKSWIGKDIRRKEKKC